MKKLLSEIITAWWSEVDTKLVNPKSEEAIKALKLVLREDFGFDSDVIDYVVEMVRSTPTNFDLGGKTSGIDVGKNQTAVSAQLHPVWDDDEEEDDEDEEEVTAIDDDEDEGSVTGTEAASEVRAIRCWCILALDRTNACISCSLSL